MAEYKCVYTKKKRLLNRFSTFFQDTYNTFVEYKCVNGSQFDTNNDKVGDAISIQIRCLWNKNWSPWPVLPSCYITHCVNPFPIPNDTSIVVSLILKYNFKKQIRWN